LFARRWAVRPARARTPTQLEVSEVTAMTVGSSPSLWTAAARVDDNKPRSVQKQLGASDTVCERRAAYIVHAVPRTDDSDKKIAILGTYIHDGALPALRKEFGWLIERSVDDGTIRGHIDVVQLDEQTAARLPVRHRPLLPAPPEHGVTVEDLKTVRPERWDRVVRYGATDGQLRQVYLYADLLRTVGFEDVKGQRYLAKLGPLDVRWIRFRFVNRGSGEEHIQEFPFDPGEATRARWWVQNVVELADPEQARRDFDGPGLDIICDNCPWRTACWGLPQWPGAPVQANLIHDDADRAAALADYVRGREMVAEGRKIQKLARAKLDGAPPGRYGANVLGWKGGNDKDEPNPEALVDLFETANLPVPMWPHVSQMVKTLERAGLPVPLRKSHDKTPKTIDVKAAPPGGLPPSSA
jgi:hypothetical protein